MTYACIVNQTFLPYPVIPYDLHYKRYCSFFDRPFLRSHFPPAQYILYRSRFSRCRMTKLNYLIISVFTGHLDHTMAHSGNQLKASSFSKGSSKFRPELYRYIYSGRLVTTNSGPKTSIFWRAWSVPLLIAGNVLIVVIR